MLVASSHTERGLRLASFTVVTSLDMSCISSNNHSRAARSLSYIAEEHWMNLAVRETLPRTSRVAE